MEVSSQNAIRSTDQEVFSLARQFLAPRTAKLKHLPTEGDKVKRITCDCWPYNLLTEGNHHGEICNRDCCHRRQPRFNRLSIDHSPITVLCHAARRQCPRSYLRRCRTYCFDYCCA